MICQYSVAYSQAPATGTMPIPPTRNKAGILAPDSRPYLYYVGSPGSTVSDNVAVVNYSPTPVTLSVFATDALNDDQGGFTLLKSKEKPKDVGAWTTIGLKRLTVTVPARSKNAAGQETYGFVIVPFSVKVPALT